MVFIKWFGMTIFYVVLLIKTTGKKTFQIYTVIYYAGSGTDSSWKNFNQVDYQTPKGDILRIMNYEW
jgi:hypothetical protein